MNTLDITEIDYSWADKQTNPKMIKKALKMLKEDGKTLKRQLFPPIGAAFERQTSRIRPKIKVYP